MIEEFKQIASHRITFTENQMKEILKDTEEILRSGQVILGKKTQQFEEEFAATCNRQYGLAVSSDTAAFEIQLKVLGVKDEYVLFPALAFPSILESVYNAGAKPWFVDANLEGHLFASLDEVKNAYDTCLLATGKAPKALILMHTAGLIARDSALIAKWGEENNVAILEDAAHSFGATLDGDPAGSFGMSSAFSLYATKPMHACEGGIIVTDNLDLIEKGRLYRNYGRTSDFGRSIVTVHGYSWRITEIQSAIGLSNLKAMDASVTRRRQIMDMYDTHIESNANYSNVTRLYKSPGMKPNGYRYILVGPENWNHATRLEFKHFIKTNYGIDLPGEVYELPTHKQPVWEDQYGHLSLPVAESFCERHFALPVYQSMTDDQVAHVLHCVGEALKKFTK